MSSMSTDVNAVPRGFRDRGTQVTRLEAFVDAAFAFAVTLLVISLDSVPESIPALVDALKHVPAFAMSFILIVMFWRAHATWSRRYGLDDGFSNVLSLTLVGLVLVYVYPLKIVSGTFFSWVTDGWIPWPVRITGYGDILDMFVVYGLAFFTLSLCIAALYARAWRLRSALQLAPHEVRATAGSVAVWAWAAAVGGCSIVSTLIMPDDTPYWLTGLPGVLYFLINLSGLVAGVVERRVASGEAQGAG